MNSNPFKPNRVKSVLMQVWKRRLPGSSASDDPMASLPKRLWTLAKGLRADSGGVESDFLSLGRELQKTHEDASGLVRYAHDTVAMADGDEGLLQQIDRVVHAALTELQICRDKVCADVTRLTKGAELMGDLVGLCRIIDQMVLELRMVGLNISVESVRTAEGRDLFGPVASDVRNVTKKIAHIAETIRDDAKNTGTLQEDAIREISEDIAGITIVAADAERAVQEAVDDIRSLMALSTSAMNDAAGHSREISGWVGKVVEGIQFHDNMHQRVTHITEALIKTADGIADHGKQGADTAHAVTALQVAQLKQVIHEIDDAHAENSLAFDGIARHVGELARSVSALNSGASGKSPADDRYDAKHLFSELGAVIGRLKHLMEQGRRLHERILDAFDHAASSANELSDAVSQVRNINFDIHLLALNAVIKAAHMGSEGRALEVMAQAVSSLSNRSNEYVSRVDGLLAGVLSAADTGRSPGNDAVCVNEAFLKERGIDITGACERLDLASDQIITHAEVLIQSVSDTRDRLSFLNDLKDRLSRRLRELESCELLLRPKTRIPERSRSLGADQLNDRYTMEQERLVHDRWKDSSRDFYRIDTLEPVVGTDGDVEMFDAPLPDPIVPPPASAPDELGENVELF